MLKKTNSFVLYGEKHIFVNTYIKSIFMKKVWLFCVMFLTICACSEEDNGIQLPPKKETPNKEIRNLNEAVLIARNALNFFKKSTTRHINKKIDIKDVKHVLSATTRSGESDTLLYIVNYTDNNGFAVVSANKNTEGLLAVTENGYYTSDNNYEENEGFTAFMDMAKGYVSTKSISNPPNQDIDRMMELKFVSDTIDVIQNGPKVTVQWGQSGVEGTFCPNKVAGCSNVAMAQIMSYFCYPSQININYEGATVNTLNLNWNVMKLHRINHEQNSSCQATNATHIAIGQLHRQLGHINKSEYGYNATSTYANDVKTSFQNLGYTVSSLINYSNEDFSSQIKNGKLMYMRGSRKITNPTTGYTTYSGHAWVVDGSLQLIIQESEWTRYVDELKWNLLEDYGTRTSNYFHINWGWNGSCNGYFSVNAIATNNGFMYDNGSGINNNIDRNYKYNMQYFEVTR